MENDALLAKLLDCFWSTDSLVCCFFLKKTIADIFCFNMVDTLISKSFNSESKKIHV